jgi:hypothetical protein
LDKTIRNIEIFTKATEKPLEQLKNNNIPKQKEHYISYVKKHRELEKSGRSL